MTNMGKRASKKVEGDPILVSRGTPTHSACLLIALIIPLPSAFSLLLLSLSVSFLHVAMDIFDLFFGGGGRRSREKRTKDMVYPLKVRVAVTCYWT